MLLISILFSFSLLAHDTTHLPIDASAKDVIRYHSLSKSDLKAFSKGPANAMSDSIRLGQNLLDWIEKHNQNNPTDPIQLSGPDDPPKGYPIERMVRNNDREIAKRLSKLRSTAPSEILRPLENGAFPRSLPLSREDFIKWGRVVDSNYSRALRWRMQRGNLNPYRRRKSKDISGYLILKGLEDRQQKLERFNQLPTNEQTQIQRALISLCENSGTSYNRCQSQFRSHRSGGTLNRFFQSNESAGKRKYDQFFRFYHVRNDLTRRGDVITYPFRRPRSQRIQQWFKENVENTWQTDSWEVKVRFTSNAASTLSFQPDVTPHVSGGNHIVMNSRANIEEPIVKWTLTHEFGHTLGFQDCYLEFYDDGQRAMIYYEVDISNIMCSKAGRVNKSVENLLERYY